MGFAAGLGDLYSPEFLLDRSLQSPYACGEAGDSFDAPGADCEIILNQ